MRLGFRDCRRLGTVVYFVDLRKARQKNECPAESTRRPSVDIEAVWLETCRINDVARHRALAVYSAYGLRNRLAHRFISLI